MPLLRIHSVNQDELRKVLDKGYRYALSLTHDQSSAEDLVQDAWIRVSKKHKRNVPIAYFIKTIRNRFIDTHRRARLVPMKALDEKDEAFFSLGAPMYCPEPALERALAKLKSEEREVLYLMVVVGYSAAELAELLERPRGTILSLAHRAKEKLRKLLNKNAVGHA